MYRCRLTPYEGDERYVFISYAHKDSDQVLPILDHLADAGVRIWYDEGIAPGSEWPEYIADHLNRSDLVIAFVTPNSIASMNCRREVTFALSKNKSFIGMMLEPTELTLGMEMQLSAQQCIIKYQFDTEEKFYQKVFATPEIIRCMDKQEPVVPTQSVAAAPPKQATAPASEAAPKQATAPASEAAPKQTATPAPETAPKQTTTPAPEVAPKSSTTPKQEKAVSTAKKKNGIKIALIVAIFLVVIMTVMLIVGGGVGYAIYRSKANKYSANNIDLFSNDMSSYVTVEKASISHRELVALSKYKELYMLTFENCTFDDTDLSELKKSKRLDRITFINCSGITSYEGIAEISTLNTIVIDGCSMTDNQIDLSACESLFRADFSNNLGFTDLSLLPTSLTSLDISNTGVTDFSYLSNMTYLNTLDVSQINQPDVDIIFSNAKLTDIKMSNCNLKSLPATWACENLINLDLSDNELTEIDGAFVCSRLVKVYVANNRIQNLAPLFEASHSYLEKVDVNNNPLDEASIQAMLGLERLTLLHMRGIKLNNLDGMTEMPNLVDLDASNCGLKDISTLKNCTKLTRIRLDYNNLTDISCLSGLNESYITYINLSHNQISNFSPVNGRTISVFLVNENPTDYSTLGDGEGTWYSTLVVTYSKDIKAMSDKKIASMIILGCPEDQQENLSDYFSSVVFSSEEEIKDNSDLFDDGNREWEFED